MSQLSTKDSYLKYIWYYIGVYNIKKRILEITGIVCFAIEYTFWRKYACFISDWYHFGLYHDEVTEMEMKPEYERWQFFVLLGPYF